MIDKLILLAFINKYYLGVNEAVKWVMEDNTLTVKFMSPGKDLIGEVVLNEIPLEENGTIAIYNTKKLLNLLNICNGNLLMDFEKQNSIYTKMFISDSNYNLTYALAFPNLIGKVGEVTTQEWDTEVVFEYEHLENLVKAKNALSDIDNMVINTIETEEDGTMVEFVFGDEEGHNNKITYRIPAEVEQVGVKLPFNSEIFKSILHTNKDMIHGKLYLNRMGLMKLAFQSETSKSEYFLVRKSEKEF